MNADRVWNSLPDTPRKAFGSALKPELQEKIVTPEIISTWVRPINDPELRKAIDGGPNGTDA